MTKLKVKKAGHTLRIPGVPECRSPVEIDISNLKLNIVLSYLKNSGIEEYEITSDFEQEKKEKEKARTIDVVKKKIINRNAVLDRIDKLEKKLDEQSKSQEKSRNDTKKEEQIINKLDRIEKLFSSIKFVSTGNGSMTVEKYEPEIEELESFIPDVDLEGMTLSSAGSSKTIKKDNESIDESADLLANLMKKKK